MSDRGKNGGDGHDKSGKMKAGGAVPVSKPDWADGLKQFYDSVVDEPLPDDLAALLSKLDDGASE
ncbi:hypothetical protein GCM10009127_07180 [Alteraurantiacibacter aestuarii]|nr:NepR family anti-sigma factor [Alteraurantiacibacter aestuarii]